MKNFTRISVLIFMMTSLLSAGAAASVKTEVLATSKQIVTALKNKDMTKLAKLVHPIKGVRFSPYNYIDPGGGQQVIKRVQIAGLWNSRKIYLWGMADGSGDPLEMRFSKYYRKFVYDKDFLRVSPKYYKDVDNETNLSSVSEAYPKANFVEYYVPAAKGQPEMAWAGLWLAIERSGKKWYLVGIFHDEWTI